MAPSSEHPYPSYIRDDLASQPSSEILHLARGPPVPHLFLLCPPLPLCQRRIAWYTHHTGMVLCARMDYVKEALKITRGLTDADFPFMDVVMSVSVVPEIS